MLKMFDALPAYFGGKRKLAKQIIMYAEGKTFIDGFLGGGSVSRQAKAAGYQVIANDIADRCAIVGNALIVNSDITIEDEDLAYLFTPRPDNKHFIRDHQAHMFKSEVVEFLDNARDNIDRIHDPIKQAVMMLLWIKVILHYRPMSSFTHPRAVEKLESEEVETSVLQHLQEIYSRPLFEVLQGIARDINSGIFENGLDNKFVKADVFEFLPQVQGDTVYLDPPYFGAQSYEYFYNALDQMLLQKPFDPIHSVFNTKQVVSNTIKLFECCDHIPTWIFSIGERVIDRKKYIELMSEYRNVEEVPVSHAHSYGVGYNDRSGAQEVMLVGRPK